MGYRLKTEHKNHARLFHAWGTLLYLSAAGLSITDARAQTTELQEIVVQGGSGGGRGATEAFLRNSVVAKESATGTKTATPLLETPQSISVVTPKQWTEQGATDANQALRYTVGVSAAAAGTDQRFDNFYIRGFNAPLYLDGLLLPIGGSQFARSRIDLFGLQEIDVLRGAAASALYGQNPPGGLINFVSLRPTDKPVHTLQARVNSFGNAEGDFDIGGPLDREGHYLYRLTGVYLDGGSQIDFDRDQRIYIAPAFTFAPDAATTFTILGKYQRDRTGTAIQFFPALGTLYSGPFGRVPLNRLIGEPTDVFSRDQYHIGYLFEHHFDDGWAVRQNLRYAAIRTNLVQTGGPGTLLDDNRTFSRGLGSVPENAANFTIDNQLEKRFDTGPFKHLGLLGVDYRHATSDFGRGAGPVSSIDLFNPVYNFVTPAAPVAVPVSDQRQSQAGVYAQDQIKLGRFGLTISGRHDWVDTKSLTYPTATTPTTTTTLQNDRAFSGRAALNYVADSGVAPYIAVARSFLPSLGLTETGAPLKPTTGDEFEAGIKYQPVGVNALFTAAIFDVNQQNYISPSTLGLAGTFVQTGTAHIQGAELEAKMSLGEGLDVVASYSHLEGRIGGTNNPALDNHRINVVPADQAAAYADYTFHSTMLRGFGFGAGVRFVGDSYGDLANTLRIPAYTLFDAGVHYDFAALDPRFAGARLAINAFNLGDTYYVSSCAAANQCYLGAARLVRAQMTYTW